MPIVTITKYKTIELAVDAGVTTDDISIVISTDVAKANIELSPPKYTLKIKNNILQVKPDTLWLEGINIAISISGVAHSDMYRVPSNTYIYDPEQILYTRGILATATATDLLDLGLVTEDEISLLQAMGPKLTIVFDKLSELLCAKFLYDNSTPNQLVNRVISFRRMQQLAYLFNLDSLVESILLSPGPVRSWFREATVPYANKDSFVLERINTLKKEVAALSNAMTRANLNTQVIKSLDFQVDNKSDYYALLSSILTLFCGIRYTHDNSEFRY